MIISRRRALLSTLLGAGDIGLRALATGLPISFLLNPQRALADGLPACGNRDKAQYLILNTSGLGDPINANAPGCYLDANIFHPDDPAMAATSMRLGAQTVIGAKPWAQLPQNVLDRTAFWHVKTNTPIHPKEPEVLRLMGAIKPSEMFPSLLAKNLATCFGTIQSQPITLGASSPSEGLSYNGAALPILPPLSLKATLANPQGPLGALQGLRDTTLNQLSDVLKTSATKAQRSYLDSLITSQAQIRGIRQELLASLDSITNNDVPAQITAALALIQMNVTPVVTVHIPFGGDNHHDDGLVTETAQTLSGVSAIGSLMSQLSSAGLQDKVSFLSLNVFGRTLGPASSTGRQHNENHQVSIAIGKPFRGGVIGGVTPVAGDFGALDIESATGKGAAGADIAAIDTLAAFGKTVMTAVGIDAGVVNASIPAGKVVTGMLS